MIMTCRQKDEKKAVIPVWVSSLSNSLSLSPRPMCVCLFMVTIDLKVNHVILNHGVDHVVGKTRSGREMLRILLVWDDRIGAYEILVKSRCDGRIARFLGEKMMDNLLVDQNQRFVVVVVVLERTTIMG